VAVSEFLNLPTMMEPVVVVVAVVLLLAGLLLAPDG
jgi:hypothetical protein